MHFLGGIVVTTAMFIVTTSCMPTGLVDRASLDIKTDTPIEIVGGLDKREIPDTTQPIEIVGGLDKRESTQPIVLVGGLDKRESLEAIQPIEMVGGLDKRG